MKFRIIFNIGFSKQYSSFTVPCIKIIGDPISTILETKYTMFIDRPQDCISGRSRPVTNSLTEISVFGTHTYVCAYIRCIRKCIASLQFKIEFQSFEMDHSSVVYLRFTLYFVSSDRKTLHIRFNSKVLYHAPSG